MSNWVQWAVGIALLIAVAAVVHVFWIRPWCMRWGATDDEVSRSWPGDHLVPRPKSHATHVITIRAPASIIWPWLVQVGQDRAGFYSYDWLERLFGFDMHNADRIVPQWQRLDVGDGIRLHPKATPLSVVMIEPEHAIVLAGGRQLQPEIAVDPSLMALHSYRAYTWAFFLEQQQDGSTRFIARIRATWDRSLLNFLHNWFIMEPTHLIMQRKMNLGLKQRAESCG